MIDLKFNTVDVDVMATELGATHEQLRLAMNSAVRKINVTIRRAALRRMAEDTGLPQKRFARRIRSFKVGRDGTAWKVFIGLDSINLRELGAKETKTGVAARGTQYQGAFFGKSVDGRDAVFKRVGAGRLPIKQVRRGIEPIGDNILDDAAQIFETRFWKVLEAELKWRTQTRR
jgi:hypothetical protein